MSNITKDQVIEWLSGQSVLEIAGLVKDLETKWGVSAAAPVAAAARPPRPPPRCPRRGEDGVHRHPPRGRRQQDRRHQGSARNHRPRPQGSQGPGRGAPKPVKEGVSKRRPRKSKRSSRPPAPRSSSSNRRFGDTHLHRFHFRDGRAAHGLSFAFSQFVACSCRHAAASAGGL